ncbi:MAG: PilZ domain-containing protein [Candidatus Aminicenantes bacterium]|nr:PilZ domain-containing protein [Candidatus Aminicenantes bacterium]
MMRKERRKYFRFDCSCFGEARFQNSSVEKVSIKNLSVQGLKIVSGHQCISIGDPVEVRIDIPGRQIPPLVSGQIRWIHEEPESTELGIQLNELNNDTRRELMDYGFSVWRDRMQHSH